ncbi:MAG: DUF1304 domain-containing protein [Polyangiaceae bacterium]|nr:DUF1304 domain-containing protein [Polyangiaceae bacterium]
MTLLANVLTTLVAVFHVGFMVLEMFFWNHAVGQRVFQLPPDVLASSAVLAANQGLYNGLLAVGLLWSTWTSKRDVQAFFLGWVVVAGIFGAATAKLSILFTQALPGAVALAFVIAVRRIGPARPVTG